LVPVRAGRGSSARCAEIVGRYRASALGDGVAPGAERVRVHTHVIPTRTDRTDPTDPTNPSD
ncbi:hypothetical protein ABZ035_14605, partial [Streptomyces sp. NPDC006334]